METKICSRKDCIHGGKPQPVTNFYKRKTTYDGYRCECKDCSKKDNDSYYQENSEPVKSKAAKYRDENRETINKYFNVYHKKLALYKSWYNKLSKYDECRRDPNNPELLQVKCKYCNNWFNPNTQEVQMRLLGINYTTTRGERNLYCSNACKEACPIYGKQTQQKDFESNTSREVNAVLRKIVLEQDNWTCQLCGRSKSDDPELELHVHHEKGYTQNPIFRDDPDNCITVCRDCHNWLHHKEGCGYHQLRCKK